MFQSPIKGAILDLVDTHEPTEEMAMASVVLESPDLLGLVCRDLDADDVQALCETNKGLCATVHQNAAYLKAHVTWVPRPDTITITSRYGVDVSMPRAQAIARHVASWVVQVTRAQSSHWNDALKEMFGIHHEHIKLVCVPTTKTGRAHGLWCLEVYHPARQKWVHVAEWSYVKGRLHGTCQAWYPHVDGRLVWSKAFRRGRVHGLVRHWDKDGSLVSMTPYFNGLRHGTQLRWDSYPDQRRYVHGVEQHVTPWFGG